MKIRLGLCLAGVVLVWAGCRGDASHWMEVRERCKTLELGMSEQQVRAIMGPPAKERVTAPGRGPEELVLMYPGHPALDYQPSVYINKATGRADDIICTADHRKSVNAPSRGSEKGKSR